MAEAWNSGIVGGTYGIGGGAIIAPFFVSWFRLPVHTISGATLMGTFLTSVAGVIFYMIIAPFFPIFIFPASLSWSDKFLIIIRPPIYFMVDLLFYSSSPAASTLWKSRSVRAQSW